MTAKATAKATTKVAAVRRRAAIARAPARASAARSRVRSAAGAGAEARARAEAYLKSVSPAARAALRKVRALVRVAAPRAVDHFSYGIPGYRLDDKPLLWYAGWKRHISLYPITPDIQRTHAAAIKGYKTSTGTIQFPLDAPLPLSLIKRLIKARVATLPGRDGRA